MQEVHIGDRVIFGERSGTVTGRSQSGGVVIKCGDRQYIIPASAFDALCKK